MHADAHDFVKRSRWGGYVEDGIIVEFGSRYINGSVRDLFDDPDDENNAEYIGVDIEAGDGVDVVADAATWTPKKGVKVAYVVCCEVFEHTDKWEAIIGNAYRILAPGGVFICTAAGPGRAPHSAVDGAALRAGEYYANIPVDDLYDALFQAGFVDIDATEHGADVYARAVKPDG